MKELAANAVWIEERNKDVSMEELNEKEKQAADERLQRWKKLLNGNHGHPIFEKRIKAEGMTESDAWALCTKAAPSQEAATLTVPAIAAVSAYSGEAYRTLGASGLKAAAAMDISQIKKEGPLLALLPFVAQARKLLLENISQDVQTLFSAAAMEHIMQTIFDRLYLVCAQVFNNKASTMLLLGQITGEELKAPWKSVERQLLEGKWEELLEEYPVLARQIGTSILFFVDFISEFANGFAEDKDEIERLFFDGRKITEISGVKGEVSDLHKKGRSVLILNLSFEGSDDVQKLVYKPRSLEIDIAWREFTALLPAQFKLKAPKCLGIKEHGYIEYIQHTPCKSRQALEEYYRNAGALTALIYAFGGNDFHFENIIACGTSPVIIDTETLMIPEVRPFAQNTVNTDSGADKERENSKGAAKKKSTPEDALAESVLMQGMLPLWILDSEKKRIDNGALTGKKKGMKNLPVFDGTEYTAKSFRREVAAGFSAMYDWLFENRQMLTDDALELFKNCRFRMLIRTSQTYGNLISNLLQPVNLKDGFDYSMKAERLVNAFLYEAPDEILPTIIKVFLSEKHAVERGDIPIFFAQPDGEGILDESGLLFETYFSMTPLERAKEKILKLNDEDKNIQLQIIDRSLAAEERDAHSYYEEKAISTFEKMDDDDILLAEAEEIYQRIMAERFCVGDEYTWLAEQYDLSRGGTSLNVMGPAMYDGLLGITSFVSALYAATGKEEYRETGLCCMKRAAAFTDAIKEARLTNSINSGYSNGAAGFIKGFELCSEYLNAPAGKQASEKLLQMLTEAIRENDAALDVLSGSAGLVLTLTEFVQSQPEALKAQRKLLEVCGRRILAAQTEIFDGHRVWKSIESMQPLTGIGHGVSGIGLACLKLYGEFGDKEYLDAAIEAARYEDSVFDESAGNWPDFRRDPKAQNDDKKRFMAGYCSGAPGIGLARIEGLRVIGGLEHTSDDDACMESLEELKKIYEKDLARAINFVRNLKREGRNHLCCGTAGRVEFLVEAAVYAKEVGSPGCCLEYGELMDMARKRLSYIVEGRRRRGFYNFHVVDGDYYYDPTMFQGEAGIGYEILRLIAPEKIRSILI